MLPVREIALFFAVDAAAVLLAIEPHLLGKPYPLLPAGSEVFVMKFYTMAFAALSPAVRIVHDSDSGCKEGRR